MERSLEVEFDVSWQGILLRENTVEVLTDYIPEETTDRVLREVARHGERERCLPGRSVVWLVIGLGVWASESTKSVWRKVTGTFKSLLMAGLGMSLPVRSAYSLARARLGARPMAKLFREVSRPVTTEDTPGAFYRGLRLFAIDGLTLDVPDTPANAKAFGRPSTKRNGQEVKGAFPQIHLTLLEETGSHIITNLVIKRAKSSEVSCAAYLTQHLSEHSLTMFDRLFYSYQLIRRFAWCHTRT